MSHQFSQWLVNKDQNYNDNSQNDRQPKQEPDFPL